MSINEKAFDLQEYMTHGIERIVSSAIKATFKNPKESLFMFIFAKDSKKASKKRKKAENIFRRFSSPALRVSAICIVRGVIRVVITLPRTLNR